MKPDGKFFYQPRSKNLPIGHEVDAVFDHEFPQHPMDPLQQNIIQVGQPRLYNAMFANVGLNEMQQGRGVVAPDAHFHETRGRGSQKAAPKGPFVLVHSIVEEL